MRITRTRNFILAATFAFAGVASARADDDRAMPSYPVVDIDSLKASVRTELPDWHVAITYEIETETTEVCRFDLVLRLWAHGRPLLDEAGRPIEFVVLLDRPTEVDDDELEFKGRFNTTLVGGLDVHPDDLRIDALIVDRQTERVVKHKDNRVKDKTYRPDYGAAGIVASSLSLAAAIVWLCD